MTSSSRVFKHGEYSLFTATLRIFILGISKCFRFVRIFSLLSQYFPHRQQMFPGAWAEAVQGEIESVCRKRKSKQKVTGAHPSPCSRQPLSLEHRAQSTERDLLQILQELRGEHHFRELQGSRSESQ